MNPNPTGIDIPILILSGMFIPVIANPISKSPIKLTINPPNPKNPDNTINDEKKITVLPIVLRIIINLIFHNNLINGSKL